MAWRMRVTSFTLRVAVRADADIPVKVRQRQNNSQMAKLLFVLTP